MLVEEKRKPKSSLVSGVILTGIEHNLCPNLPGIFLGPSGIMLCSEISVQDRESKYDRIPIGRDVEEKS